MYKRAMKTQKSVIDILIRSKEKDRLSHAYLFSGEQGTEKLGVALIFAMSLYCEKKSYCGECSNCKRILRLNHPNVIYIKPDGESIKKQQIINLQKEFSKSSLEDGPRIYIIDKIEKMTTSSSNSLLKFIEEPINANTYGLLLSDNISKVLPTIISRCQVINFTATSNKYVMEELMESGFEKETANIVSKITNSISECEELIEGPMLNNIIKIVNELGNIMEKKSQSSLIYMRDKYGLLDDRDNFALFLRILLISLKDWLIENKKNIKKEIIIEYINMVIKMQKRLNFYVNHILLLELFLIKIDGGK